MLDLHDEKYVLCNFNTILRSHRLWVDMKNWYENAEEKCWWKLLKKNADEDCWKKMLMKTAEKTAEVKFADEKMLRWTAEKKFWDGFCWNGFCWSGFYQRNGRRWWYDSIANDLIDDSESEMKGGDNFFTRRKKLHFGNKNISGCESSAAKSSLLNLRC